ncbi:hypothetical protein TIFTF001_001507 [Ficus carica]|uniref:Uncharacterized protein n=1 Tax=Ficus carica TaxID=3494 RepID=A0AA87ZGG2_FICCA|nr:hypothetical protein TIFTF001_001507 [Ficus carica]
MSGRGTPGLEQAGSGGEGGGGGESTRAGQLGGAKAGWRKGGGIRSTPMLTGSVASIVRHHRREEGWIFLK